MKVSKKNGNHTRFQRYLVLSIALDITTVENTRVENKPPRSSWQLEQQWRLSTILATYKCTQYPTASSKHSHYDAEDLPSGVRDLVVGLGARTELTRIVTMHPRLNLRQMLLEASERFILTREKHSCC